MSRISNMQQTPVFWCKMHITISECLKYARKCKNLGYMGFLGTFESIAGSHDQIRASHNVSNFTGATNTCILV